MIRKWKRKLEPPSFHIKIMEWNADNPHYIQAHPDGSKSKAGFGAGIAMYQDNNLT